MSIPAKALYLLIGLFIIGQYFDRHFAISILFLHPFSLEKKLKITSAYEYFRSPFDIRSRLFASLSFMLFHIGRIAIITYLTRTPHYVLS